MPDKSIGELTAATQVNNADLFVLEQGGAAKKLTGKKLEEWLLSMADGHGGIASISKTSTSGLSDTYTIVYADESTTDFTVMNGNGIADITYDSISGVNRTNAKVTFILDDGSEKEIVVYGGEKGDHGINSFVYFKFSENEPTSDEEMHDTPDNWIGVYSGTSATAPTSYHSYTWVKAKGEQGEQGEQGVRGEKGNSGAYIWRASQAPTQSATGYYDFPVGAVTGDYDVDPRQYDLMLYGSTYYTVVSANESYVRCESPYELSMTGIPIGGTTGQGLIKASNDDYDVAWGDVQDIKYATYGETTALQIRLWYSHPYGVACKLRIGDPIDNHYRTYYLTHAVSGSDFIFTCVGNDKVYWIENNNNVWSDGYVAIGGGGGGSDQVFWATYGTTTSAQIEAAYQAHKVIKCERNGLVYNLCDRATATEHYFSTVKDDEMLYLSCENGVWGYDSVTPLTLMPSASDVGAVAVAQGVAHAGDFLVVGSDGNVTAKTMTAWQGGSF